MRFHRPERVSDLIIEELNKFVSRDLEFPETLITITDVDVSKDLEQAKVKVSVIPSEKADKVFSVLKKSQGHFQHLLLKKLNIKPLPRIEFEIDHGFERAAEVEKKLLDDYNK